jgi:hypothetical protein
MITKYENLLRRLRKMPELFEDTDKAIQIKRLIAKCKAKTLKDKVPAYLNNQHKYLI